jgi:hypothetical protein
MNTKLTTILLLAAVLTTGAAAQTQQTTSQTTTSERSNVNLQATFINSDPVPLKSGESGDIAFKIRNTGNTDAENVKVELLNYYPFEVKPDRKRNYSLGTLTPGQEYQISTEVMVAEDAPDGSSNFRVRLSNKEFSRTANIPVEVQSEDIDLNLANLKTQPQQLMPDTDSNLMTVDVVNNGEKTAENTVLNLDLPDYFERTSSFSTRQALGNIQSGQVKTAEFNFDISENAPSGISEIEGEIGYTPGDSSSEITEPVRFELHLEGKPQFNIESVESNLKTGSTGEVRLEVKNTGDEKSSSTRIRVLDSSDQPFSYDSSSQYIGTLESNQTGTAVFEVDTDSGAAAKDYLIDFETRGVKGTEVFVEDSTAQVTVSNGEEQSLPLLPLGAAVLVLAAAAYFFRDRLRNLKASEE